jgi:hypothetical protein
MQRVLLVMLGAYLCSCSSSSSTTPATTPATPVAIAPDASIADAPPPPDAAEPDPAVAAAPPSVFRFYSTGLVPTKTGPRLETWTLRHAGDRGMVLVERMAPDGEAFEPASKTLYLGTATDDGKTLTLTLAAGTDQLALACKREKLAIAGATAVRKPHKKGKYKECGDPGRWVPDKTKSVEVLQCKHPDFDAPMPFAAAPGVEYLYVNDDCQMQGGGYRAIATDAAIAPVR